MEFLNEIKLLCLSHYKIVTCLLVMCCIDIITGIIKGVYNKEFSSSKLKKGLLVKPTYFLVLISMALIQLVFNIPVITKDIFNVTISLSLVSLLACFYLITELTSIMENTKDYIPYPKWLLTLLSKLNKSFNEIDIELDN